MQLAQHSSVAGLRSLKIYNRFNIIYFLMISILGLWFVFVVEVINFWLVFCQ